MPDHIRSIRSKLSEAELAYLKDSFGVELRDPEVVAAMSEFDHTRRQIAAIEEKELRKIRERDGQTPRCSFCEATSHAVGPLAQSSRGPFICRVCAEHSISVIQESQQHEA